MPELLRRNNCADPATSKVLGHITGCCMLHRSGLRWINSCYAFSGSCGAILSPPSAVSPARVALGIRLAPGAIRRSEEVLGRHRHLHRRVRSLVWNGLQGTCPGMSLRLVESLEKWRYEADMRLPPGLPPLLPPSVRTLTKSCFVLPGPAADGVKLPGGSPPSTHFALVSPMSSLSDQAQMP